MGRGRTHWMLYLLAVVLMAATASCSIPTAPSLQSIQIGGVVPTGTNTLRMVCVAQVQNPNGSTLTLKKSFLHVWLADSRIARIEVEEEISITAGISTVQVPVRVSFRSASDLLRVGLVGWKRIAPNAELEGKIYVRYRGVPLTAHIARTPYAELARQATPARI